MSVKGHYQFNEKEGYWEIFDGESYLPVKDKDYEIQRLRKGIIKISQLVEDDDIWDFCNRLLQGEENNAPKYRIRMEE